MNLKEYLGKINKSECPQECTLKSKEHLKFALIHPPDKILGVIISRDPTFKWWGYHEFQTNEPQEKDARRRNLFDSAIPGLVIDRISKFMGDRINNDEREYLYHIIFQKLYWTHMHKCFTDEKYLPFEIKNANKCAEGWLKEELDIVIKSRNNKTKFIIALGREVQNWIKEWRRKSTRNKTVKIIKLPHPSGRSRKWNDKDDVEILKAIEELLRVCRED